MEVSLDISALFKRHVSCSLYDTQHFQQPHWPAAATTINATSKGHDDGIVGHGRNDINGK